MHLKLVADNTQSQPQPAIRCPQQFEITNAIEDSNLEEKLAKKYQTTKSDIAKRYIEKANAGIHDIKNAEKWNDVEWLDLNADRVIFIFKTLTGIFQRNAY